MARSGFNITQARAKLNSKDLTNKELLSLYRRAAKVADQRLVRLEKLSGQKNFKNVKRYAYKKASIEAAQWGANPEKPRFNIKPPVNQKKEQTIDKKGKKSEEILAQILSRTSTKAKINDILNFLEKPTSTKQGIIDIYQKRADTLNENSAVQAAGLTFTWQDVGDFFESKLYKKLDTSFGSETRIKAIGKIKQNEVELLKAFKEDRKNHIKTSDSDSATMQLAGGLSEDNMVVQEAINKMVANYSADVKKMLKIIQ